MGWYLLCLKIFFPSNFPNSFPALFLLFLIEVNLKSILKKYSKHLSNFFCNQSKITNNIEYVYLIRTMSKTAISIFFKTKRIYSLMIYSIKPNDTFITGKYLYNFQNWEIIDKPFLPQRFQKTFPHSLALKLLRIVLLYYN